MSQVPTGMSDKLRRYFQIISERRRNGETHLGATATKAHRVRKMTLRSAVRSAVKKAAAPKGKGQLRRLQGRNGLSHGDGRTHRTAGKKT